MIKLKFDIFVSTQEVGMWLVENTHIKNYQYKIHKILESDGKSSKNFHRLPESIKKLLYLDAVDIIISIDNEPILTVEISHESGTGHNSFQRFSRIVASVENNVPVAYIYPEGIFVERKSRESWDKLNPNIFKVLDILMTVHNTPALLFYYPTEYGIRDLPSSYKGLDNDNKYRSLPNTDDEEMKDFFKYANMVIDSKIRNHITLPLYDRFVLEKRDWMLKEFSVKGGYERTWSPETSIITVPTTVLLNYLSKFASKNHNYGKLLESREYSVIYHVNAKFRGDPYPGSLVALDYLKCRNGKKRENREKNLIMAWGKLKYDRENEELIFIDSKTSVNDFLSSVNTVRQGNRCLLSYTDFNKLNSNDYNISRYMMQVREGCKYTKTKEHRIYSTFADAILFKDGCLWKDSI